MRAEKSTTCVHLQQKRITARCESNCEPHVTYVNEVEGIVREPGATLDIVNDVLYVIELVFEPVPRVNCGRYQMIHEARSQVGVPISTPIKCALGNSSAISRSLSQSHGKRYTATH
jgi:hypothetical protein